MNVDARTAGNAMTHSRTPGGAARMAMKKDEAMLKAADLTAKQLQYAIDVVEGKLGADRAKEAGALVGAVLPTLADNYSRRRCAVAS